MRSSAGVLHKWKGMPVPGLAPAAKQQGAYVAAVLRARLAGRPLRLPSFIGAEAVWPRSDAKARLPTSAGLGFGARLLGGFGGRCMWSFWRTRAIGCQSW